MREGRQRLNQRRLAGVLGFTEARGLARGHQRHVSKPAEQFPTDYRRIAVCGGQTEHDQLIAVGETMLGPIGGPEFGVKVLHGAGGGLRHGLAIPMLRHRSHS
jgi:hypothetical protein